ncbi:MFS transporter [Chloroflexota bacterium]
MKYTTKLVLLLGTLHAANDFLCLLISPVLPLIITQFQLSYFKAGMISTVFLMISAILQPFLGYWADSSGKRKLLLLSGLFWVSLMFFLASFSPSYWVLILLLGLGAIGAATYHPQAVALISEAVETRQIGRSLGIHVSVGSIGIFLVPILATFISGHLGWQKAFMILAGPIMLLPIISWPLIKESRVAEKEHVSLFTILTPRLFILIVANGIATFCLASVLQLLPTYYVEIRGTELLSAGYMTSIVLAAGIVAAFVAGIAADKIGKKAVMIGALLASSAALLIFLNTSGISSLLMSALFGFGMFAVVPLFHAYATGMAPDRGRGIAIGMLFAIGQGFGALGPMVTGAISGAVGLGAALTLVAIAPVISAAICFLFPGRLLAYKGKMPHSL